MMDIIMTKAVLSYVHIKTRCNTNEINMVKKKVCYQKVKLSSQF